MATTAQFLFQAAPEQPNADAVDASAHGRLRWNTHGMQCGRAPVTRVTSPTHRPIMQSGPEHACHHNPRLNLHVLLPKTVGNGTNVAIQQWPEFAFHGAPPLRFQPLLEIAAAIVPGNAKFFCKQLTPSLNNVVELGNEQTTLH